jgi:DNA/RNA-binding domain of Phe-tRNA-synthetase-like protein
MKFMINPRIFEKFPGLKVGIVRAKQIDNRGESAEIVRLIREREVEIRRKFDPERLSQHPKISAWREAYSSFGAKPKKYKSSVESLYRVILKGNELRPINKIVDIYNYISLKHLVPVGGDDTAKVEGDIQLKFAHGDESFTALNSEEIETPKEGEVVYTDSKEVLCRRWNWRECDKTKMTEDTGEVLLVVEGLPPVTKEEVQRIIEELSTLIRDYCSGETRISILDVASQEVEI